jgi:hypothetical protein
MILLNSQMENVPSLNEHQLHVPNVQVRKLRVTKKFHVLDVSIKTFPAMLDLPADRRR